MCPKPANIERATIDNLSLSDLARFLGSDFGRTLLDKLGTTSESGSYFIKKVNHFGKIETVERPPAYDPAEYAKLFASRKIAGLETMQRRANSKALTEKLSFGLLNLGYDSELQKAYAQSFMCAGSVTEEEGRYKSKYCKHRWCLVCNRIKTAKYITDYLPHFNTFLDKRFITLTIPNVPGEQLSQAIDQMNKDWYKVRDAMRKAGRKIKGVRKLEVTYNRQRDDYHPHYHIICEGEANAIEIIDRWLEMDPARVPWAQDQKPADDESIKELFKYFTKLTSNSSKDPMLSLPALDHIFITLKGKRVFQSFGFVKEPRKAIDFADNNFDYSIKEYNATLKTAQNFADTLPNETPHAYFWSQKHSNWIDYQAGIALTNYEPTRNVLNFEKKLIYESKPPLPEYRTSNDGNENANFGQHSIRATVARRHKGSIPDMEAFENAHYVQT